MEFPFIFIFSTLMTYLNIFRHLVTTKCSQQRSVGIIAVSDLQEVVHTVVVVLNLK